MQRRRALRVLLDIAQTVVLTLVIFFVIQTFVAQPYEVDGRSMEATLEPSQLVLVDKLTPRWDGYDRGEVVVFHPPEGWGTTRGEPFIKRVIGVGGDAIELRDGDVYLNGVALDEPYVLFDGAGWGSRGGTDQARWIVADDQLFVMGDHRTNSADSRQFGPIDTGEVIGRAFLRYWPIDVFGIIDAPEHPELLGPDR
jgi:signal peptidase I